MPSRFSEVQHLNVVQCTLGFGASCKASRRTGATPSGTAYFRATPGTTFVQRLFTEDSGRAAGFPATPLFSTDSS
ncbi:MAG: hypothetical protein OXT74_07165, partial [Candidatus Poribacteria bacterium]|nr:hypothetical protein [Candidatus Poribacteria bacterium]